MLIETPDNRASYYTCGFCPLSAQVLVPWLDGDGNPVLDWEGNPKVLNDEPAASAELGQHMAEQHPQIDNEPGGSL